MKDMRQFIKTTLKDYLFESKSMGILYHFTHLMNLYFILESKTFMTRYNDLPKYNYDYSVSCTRNKSFKWGNIRIILDGDKISNRFVVKPVSYFKFNKSQSEERIFTNKETFPIFDYIIQIDILEHLKNDDIFNDVLKMLNDNNIRYNLVSNF
jgi:hypothetical protein